MCMQTMLRDDEVDGDSLADGLGGPLAVLVRVDVVEVRQDVLQVLFFGVYMCVLGVWVFCR